LQLAGENSDHYKLFFEKNEKNKKCLKLPDTPLGPPLTPVEICLAHLHNKLKDHLPGGRGDHYVLPVMPKGSACTLLGPINPSISCLSITCHCLHTYTPIPHCPTDVQGLPLFSIE
jgi:hypothetical protein